MKNLKPSELPEGTVIDDEKHGEFIKRSEGVWEEFETDMLGDRDKISDYGYEQYDARARRQHLTWREKSDDYFTNYRIIASDPSFQFDRANLHGPYDIIREAFMDGTEMHNCKGYNCEA